MMLFSYFIQRTNKQQQQKDSENDYFKPKVKPREIKK